MKKKYIIIITCAIFLLLYIIGLENKTGRIQMEAFPVEACYYNETVYFIGKIYGNNNTMKYKIYKMDYNSLEIDEFRNIELEEGMFIEKIAASNHDIFFIIHKIGTDPIYYIYKMEDENIVPLLDISEWIDPNNGHIKSFCVNNDNICYIWEESNLDIVIINMENKKSQKIQKKSENVIFESMALGKEGQLYILFSKNRENGGGYVIEKVIGLKNELKSEEIVLPYDDIYSVMGAGNDQYDIFIKGTYFIYGYNNKGTEIIKKLQVDEYEHTKSCFVDGHTLLIFGMNTKRKGNNVINCTKILDIELDG